MKVLRVAIRRGLLFLVGLVLFVGLFAISSPVWSFTARSGEQVTLAANEVVDEDLYLASNTITI